jgi:nitroimidazol reductase NimA-like FMN-containing flavoprotein (pyridoxamine 5'-phosphate oxidase superfamily)
MLDKMKALMKQKDICVLATVSDGKPHCSLMAYVTDDECREIYMVTDRLTKKYSNLMKNPAASLLIDTRDEHAGPTRLKGRALTVTGVFQEVKDQTKKDVIRNKLLDTHPHLRAFASQPDVEVISIKIESLLLLEGLTDSYFEQVA